MKRSLFAAAISLALAGPALAASGGSSGGGVGNVGGAGGPPGTATGTATGPSVNGTAGATTTASVQGNKTKPVMPHASGTTGGHVGNGGSGAGSSAK